MPRRDEMLDAGLQLSREGNKSISRNPAVMADVGEDMEAVLPVVAGLAGTSAPAAPAAEVHFALLKRCQQREPGAFEELIRCFHPRVYSVVRNLLRNSNDVDDIAQQVFAKVYFALDKFNFQSAVSTWIYKIAVNECYDHLRKQKVRKSVLESDLSEGEAARVQNFDMQAHLGAPNLGRQVELRELAGKLLGRLGPEDRILLVLKEIEGYSVKEVATLMGLNENTVKVRLFRARQALLKALERKRL